MTITGSTRPDTGARSRGSEVDFALEAPVAAVKATKNVGARDLGGVASAARRGPVHHYPAASMVPIPRVVEGMRILPWSDFPDPLRRGAWIYARGPVVEHEVTRRR